MATVTLAAVGDLALHMIPPDEAAVRQQALAGVRELLGDADLRVGNLETVLSRRGERVGRIGAYLRAWPESLEILQHGGFDLLTGANNHCTDFGAEALHESVERVRAAGIDMCGVGANLAEARRPVVRTVRGLRIGMLGYCDDWRPLDSGAGPAPATDDAILADLAALRPTVDVVVLQLHWGWEWVLHPLLSHRDRARRFAESGADVVLCHHAHVPMAVEPWGRSIIAHGLGNFYFPWPAAKEAGHPWRDRSYVLHVDVSAAGVHSARLTPVEYRNRAAQTSTALARRELLGGLAALHDGLHDTPRLAALETDRTVREGRDVARRLLAHARAGDDERVAEIARSLQPPRGAALVEALVTLPDDSGTPLAPLLRAARQEGAPAVTAAAHDGRLAAAVDQLAASRLVQLEPPGRTP